MQARFLEPAEAEVDEAVAYFDEQRDGLGDRFEQDLLDTVTFLTEYPFRRKSVDQTSAQISAAHIQLQRHLCSRS